MRGIVSARKEYPLLDLMESGHRSRCDQACYVCMQRFGNQPYHGLLDWRLGLDVIGMLLDPTFEAGVDGNFSTPGLVDWPALARRNAEEASRLVPGSEIRDVDGINLVSLGNGVWMAVVHPFWDWDSLLSKKLALSDFATEHSVRPATTFDLSRRLVSTVDNCRRTAVL
jgi:hypothetical protein